MSVEDFVIENGVFKRYTGPEVEVLEIPEGVVEIASRSFDASAPLLKKCKKIIIPASVKRIGREVMDYSYDSGYDNRYDNIEEIVFKGDIDSIGEAAFRFIGNGKIGKLGFKIITFEGKVGTIGWAAFARSRVKVIDAPKGIEKLEGYVFSGSPNLEEVIIPGLKSIGEGCFEDCKKLSKIEVPESCKAGKGAFTGCKALGDAEGKFVFAGILYNTRDNRGWDSKDKRKWTCIPEGVDTIDEYALSSGDQFVLPCSVTNIMEQRSSYYLSGIKLADGYLQTNKKITGKGFLALFKEFWAKSMSATDWAYVYLFQTGKTIEKILAGCKKDVNGIVEGMLIALEQYGKLANKKSSVF